MCGTAPSASESRYSQTRRRFGTDNTSWRTGNGGKATSTSCAATSTLHRALHEGHGTVLG